MYYSNIHSVLLLIKKRYRGNKRLTVCCNVDSVKIELISYSLSPLDGKIIVRPAVIFADASSDYVPWRLY